MQFFAKKLQALVSFDHFRIGDELVDQFFMSSFGIVIYYQSYV